MSQDRWFEVGSVGDLRRKYYKPGEAAPVIRLDSRQVPEALRSLIPLAEKWGISDDILRGDFIAAATAAEMEELKNAVQQHIDAIEEWLARPAAEMPPFSPEYLAFTNMLMASDGF